MELPTQQQSGSTTTEDTSDMSCLTSRRWYVFLSSSLVSLMGGALLLVTWHSLRYCYCALRRKCQLSLRRRVVLLSEEGESVNVSDAKEAASSRNDAPTFNRVQRICRTMKQWAVYLTNAESFWGKSLNVLLLVLSMLSWSLYIYTTQFTPSNVEGCRPWAQDRLQQVDFVCNVVFLVNFILQFVASSSKLSFWLSLYSIIDHFTIPPSFVGLVLHRHWVGLRFLRALRLFSLPDVLLFFNILTSRQSNRLCYLITVFLVIWLTGAGAFHLLENSGDPWEGEGHNAQNVTFGDSMYFCMVTMSTVGYGDIGPKTTLGRIFVILFILVALAIFANFIPEIAAMLMSRSIYNGHFHKESGNKHVVVCGNINTDSVANFLSDFLHDDRANCKETVVFINLHQPTVELSNLLKRHHTRVKYFTGTVMNYADNKRVCLERAEACFVLANKHALNHQDEDTANIMRVVSIKNYCATTRCIVQLLQHNNKSYLVNIPNWNHEENGDEVICLSELKMGFLAQSCIAPGFSTLLSNLFSMRSMSQKTDSMVDFPWKNSYLYGVAMELYSQELSPSFVGMTFTEVALICYEKLALLLIAVECPQVGLLIVPGKKTRIGKQTKGMFICDSQENAVNALYFCVNCHRDVRLEQTQQNISPCACKRNNNSLRMIHSSHPPSVKERETEFSPSVLLSQTSTEPASLEQVEITDEAASEMSQAARKVLSRLRPVVPPTCSITPIFHWCPEQSLEECLISETKVAEFRSMTNHVICCVFADGDSPKIDLQSFVLPLRSSCYTFSELMPVVFVAHQDFISREWHGLCNFPKVYVMPTSPMERIALRALNISACAMCVVMSARNPSSHQSDPHLVDKEAILCSLNVRSMTFDEQNRDIFKHVMIRFFKPGKEAVQNQTGAAVTSEGAIAVVNRWKALASKTLAKMEPTSGMNIPLITELISDSNIQYISKDECDSSGVDVYLTTEFACGVAFTASVLDSLVSASYFNPRALALIRTLVTGAFSTELESILAEGGRLLSGDLPQEDKTHRVRVEQFSLRNKLFEEFVPQQGLGKFGDLFSFALSRHDVICLGVYRFIDSQNNILYKSNPRKLRTRRIVITNPPMDLALLESDLLFCLYTFDQGRPSVQELEPDFR